jgi:putative Ca2+/H+ antiporter (TMEM165/GDT1 family)
MDWRLAASTFGLVLLAEFGDKTQLAAMTLAARTGNPISIATGAIGGLAVGTVLAVVIGQALPALLPTMWIRRGAGLLFVVSGLVMLLRS